MFADRGHPGLKPETAQHRHVVFLRPDNIGAARNTVTIRVIRVCQRQNIRSRDRFEKPKPDHLRRHTGRQHRIGVQRAIAKISRGVSRLPQGHDLAPRQGHGDFGIIDLQAVFGTMPRDGEILHLRAVGGFGERGQIPFDLFDIAGVFIARNRHAQEHGNRAVVGAFGRVSAPVLDVAALARPCVEQWPQPVRRQRRGRRRHPQLAKQPIAQFEGQLVLERHIARGLRKRIGIHARAHGGSAAAIHLERAGGVKTVRRGGYIGDTGRFIGGTRDDIQMGFIKRPGVDRTAQ